MPGSLHAVIKFETAKLQVRRQMDENEIAKLPEKTEGQRLKKLRLSAKMTQDKFSEALGFSSNYYGQVERGVKALSKNMADAVCRHFGASYSYLYQGITPEQIRDASDYDTCKNHMLALIAACTEEECRLLYSFLQMMIQDYRRRKMALFALWMNTRKRPGRPRKSSRGTETKCSEPQGDE